MRFKALERRESTAFRGMFRGTHKLPRGRRVGVELNRLVAADLSKVEHTSGPWGFKSVGGLTLSTRISLLDR